MMRRMLTVLMAFVMLLALTACKKEETEQPSTPPDQTQPAEDALEALSSLPEVEEITLAAEEMEGRLPGGVYDLPAEVVSMQEWMAGGAVGLLVNEEDVAFYAVEGKENCPALLRWGDSMAEFDWWYVTPRAIEPELWVFDIDGDGQEEVVVDCYGSSGTGVSLEYLYVVEKDADGALTSYGLPWDQLRQAVNQQLQIVKTDSRAYVALGRELVDISGEIQGHDVDELEARLGSVANYLSMGGTFGVAVEGSGIPALTLYVADVQCSIYYENGEFTLKDLHLLSI